MPHHKRSHTTGATTGATVVASLLEDHVHTIVRITEMSFKTWLDLDDPLSVVKEPSNHSCVSYSWGFLDGFASAEGVTIPELLTSYGVDMESTNG